MMAWTAEFAFEKFKASRSIIAAAEGTNEATTRQRSIDTIIYDVLGWDKLAVEPEHYCRAEGYADYALKDRANICLVIEAKKSDATFVLPNRKYPSAPIGFPLLAKECPAADSALRQALGYAASLGARYIAITNGFQWLMTLTFVLNQDVTERSVYVFESLDQIEAKFRLFWDCLSPEGIWANRPADALIESRKAPPPSKLAHRITKYPVPADRNLIVNELSTVLGAVWDRVKQEEGDEVFLTECYVEPEASETGLVQASLLLEQRLSADQQSMKKILETSDVPSLIQASSQEKPIVVLGRVGHGKTTFINYLRKIKAKDVLTKYIQLQIDFIDRPDDPKDVGHYVYSKIEEQLQENNSITLSDDTFVRAVLNADLNRFRKSPEGKAFAPETPEYKREELQFIKELRADSHSFLKKAIAHLRGSRKFSVAIFLDNLDRRNPLIQEEAYLRASAMARDWSAVVFVSLRPTTFYHSQRFGVLDSVAPRLINVASPKTEHLVVRRLKYAKKFAEGMPTPIEGNQRPETQNFTFQLPTVATFLECLIESFRKRKDLVGLFDAMSNGNARELVGHLYDVLTSLHLDTNKIIEKFRTSHYLMPPHEALRAILYGNFIHYFPEKSLVTNLFDLQRADPLEHFTRLLTLNYLCTASEEYPAHGACLVSDVVRYLCQLGYSEEHCRFTIRMLFDRRCCEGSDPVEEWTDSIKEIRITTRGRYHIAVLVNEFQYMDAMIVDTPILDDGVRIKIVDRTYITERLDRCKMFLEYLNSCSANLQDSRATQIWTDCYSNIHKSFQTVESSLARRERDGYYPNQG